MAARKVDGLTALIDALADGIAARLQKRLGATAGRPAKAGGGGRGNRKGAKLDMRCRYPGCKNRSKGPRFHFLCEEHLKLPKKALAAALSK